MCSPLEPLADGTSFLVAHIRAHRCAVCRRQASRPRQRCPRLLSRLPCCKTKTAASTGWQTLGRSVCTGPRAYARFARIGVGLSKGRLVASCPSNLFEGPTPLGVV